MRLKLGSISQTLAAALVVTCLTCPDVYGQARGGGRISTREDINRAMGGGGLQDTATNQAQSGGALSVDGGAKAGGGGALAAGENSAAGAGGGLALKTKGPAGGAASGGDMLQDNVKSNKGGGIAAEKEGSLVRSLATWIPVIAVVALLLTAGFLKYMKGKGV